MTKVAKTLLDDLSCDRQQRPVVEAKLRELGTDIPSTIVGSEGNKKRLRFGRRHLVYHIEPSSLVYEKPDRGECCILPRLTLRTGVFVHKCLECGILVVLVAPNAM